MKIDFFWDESINKADFPLIEISRLKKKGRTYKSKANLNVVNVVFVNNQFIQKLNKQYRGKDAATDVLSFNYERENEFAGNKELEKEFKGATVGNGQTETVGEIYISLPYLKKQAEEEAKNFEELVERNFVHGLLHLEGFTHETPQKLKSMRELEDKILGD